MKLLRKDYQNIRLEMSISAFVLMAAAAVTGAAGAGVDYAAKPAASAAVVLSADGLARFTVSPAREQSRSLQSPSDPLVLRHDPD